MNTVTAEFAYENFLWQKGMLSFDGVLIEHIHKLFNRSYELTLMDGRSIIVTSNFSIEYEENNES